MSEREPWGFAEEDRDYEEDEDYEEGEQCACTLCHCSTRLLPGEYGRCYDCSVGAHQG